MLKYGPVRKLVDILNNPIKDLFLYVFVSVMSCVYLQVHPCQHHTDFSHRVQQYAGMYTDFLHRVQQYAGMYTDFSHIVQQYAGRYTDFLYRLLAQTLAICRYVHRLLAQG